MYEIGRLHIPQFVVKKPYEFELIMHVIKHFHVYSKDSVTVASLPVCFNSDLEQQNGFQKDDVDILDETEQTRGKKTKNSRRMCYFFHRNVYILIDLLSLILLLLHTHYNSCSESARHILVPLKWLYLSPLSKHLP